VKARAVCIHGHFYQPPRENPWIEVIEAQESAAPFHDWNERVNAECYAPNTAARILNGGGSIRRIINNFAHLSFNVGPTLLSWMQAKAPEVYASILEADRESRRLYSGHGSAIAQAYSHPILPLCNDRDKETQIRWGVSDFRSRFDRDPEGFWLPETAVDLSTLDVAARSGIRFVILAPHQIHRVRPIGSDVWTDVGGARVDTRQGYRVNLESGRSIVVFPYDGPAAHDVSFGKLLEDGEAFHGRLLSGFDARGEAQLVHLATDGEAYGHHRRFGEMALAYVLDRLENDGSTQLTNYGEWLEQHPPTHEAEIFENTSWSCAHGIERWRSNCGCNTGAHPDWTQEWRAPLREAFDHLRDDLVLRYERRAGELLKDPWEARNGYIDVLLDRSTEGVSAFLTAQAAHPLSDSERIEALKLLELQRHAMLMYTSCGWFFDDLAGIEALQVLRYAGRVIDLAGDLFEGNFEEPLLRDLEQASSNDPARGNGRTVYEASVRPSMVDLPKVVAHHALTAPFSGDAEDTLFSAYQLETLTHDERRAGSRFLGTGCADARFAVTEERAAIAYAALHSGGTDIIVGVREAQTESDEEALAAALLDQFERGDLDGVRSRVAEAFKGGIYSLLVLFREEQRRLLNVMMQQTLGEIESAYRSHYDRTEPLLQLLADLGIPLPRVLKTLAAFMTHADLEELLAKVPFEGPTIETLFRRAQEWEIQLDAPALAVRWNEGLVRAARGLADLAEDSGPLRNLLASLESARLHKIGVDLWEVQNAYYRLAQKALRKAQDRADGGDGAAVEWLDAFTALGDRLAVDTIAASEEPEEPTAA
jgi:hypothetical protein